MEITVFGFAKGINDMIINNRSREVQAIVENLGIGQTRRKAILELKDNKVILHHSGKVTLMPDTFYGFVSKEFNFLTYKIKVDYTYLGKDRTIEKLAPYDEDSTALLRSILEIPSSEIKRISLETDYFSIVYKLSDMEEFVTFDFKAKDKAKSFFRKFSSFLFPYMTVGMNISKIETQFEFKMQDEKVGDVLIKIKYDGTPVGTKATSFKV